MSSYWSRLTSLFRLWLVSCDPSNLFFSILFVFPPLIYCIVVCLWRGSLSNYFDHPSLLPPSFTKLDERDLVLSVSLFPPQTCWYFHSNFSVIQLDLWPWSPHLWLIHKWNQSEYGIWQFSHLCYKYRLPALKSPCHQPHATAVAAGWLAAAVKKVVVAFNCSCKHCCLLTYAAAPNHSCFKRLLLLLQSFSLNVMQLICYFADSNSCSGRLPSE